MRASDGGAGRARWITDVRAELHAVDQAAYDAVATTPTPTLGRLMVSLSRTADHSGLWLVTAAAVAAVGGGPGRRAAGQGVLAIGLASAVTNLGLKPLASRTRPWRSDDRPAPASRRIRRPKSTSFPSGHAASAFASRPPSEKPPRRPGFRCMRPPEGSPTRVYTPACIIRPMSLSAQ
jgi:undecaprenyl-diphosphatase